MSNRYRACRVHFRSTVLQLRFLQGLDNGKLRKYTYIHPSLTVQPTVHHSITVHPTSNTQHPTPYSLQPLTSPSRPPQPTHRTMSLARSIRPIPTYRSLTLSLTRATHSVPTPSKPLPTAQPSSADSKTYQQSPNVAHTWSTSQMPRKEVYAGPRFEQTALDLQPNSLSAQGMVAEDPVRIVQGRKATCDGGESSSGCFCFCVCGMRGVIGMKWVGKRD